MNPRPNPHEIHQLFDQHQLRCTQQRLAIYQSLCQSKAHPTASELFKKVRAQLPGISLATVYNNLEAFTQAGLIRKMVLNHGQGNGCARYDAHCHKHLHVRCKNTGSVKDLPDHLGQQLLSHIPEKLLEQIGREIGCDIHDVQIELIASETSRHN